MVAYGSQNLTTATNIKKNES